MGHEVINIIFKVYENLMDGVMVSDISGYALFVNRRLAEMSGYESDVLRGKGYRLLFDPEGRRAYDALSLSVFNKKGSQRTGMLSGQQIIRMDKEKLHVDVDVNVIEYDGEQYMVSIFHDISELFKTREMLLKEMDRMAEAKKLAKFGHWELDLIEDDLYWSDEVYAMFGVDKENFEPSYEVFLNKVHAEDREKVNESFARSVADKTAYEIVHKVVLDDRVHHYRENGKTFYDGDTPVKTIGLVQDITDKVNKDIVINKKETELQKTKSAIIYALSSLTEMRDNETGRHIERTQAYVRLIAEALGRKKNCVDSEECIDILVQVAPLHDIGKVGIPDHILSKPGKLTDDEFEIMKRHTLIGRHVIEKAKKTSEIEESIYLDMAQRVIYSHHEKWDGTGYPEGLKGEGIPIEARIMALADVYDALRTKRVYKDAISHEKSMVIIAGESGRHFDPDIVRAFLTLEKVFENISEKLQD